MFNIIALIILSVSFINPSGIKPAHYQEYDLIGEMPTVEITATRYESNQNDIDNGMMPTVEITAEKTTPAQTVQNLMPAKIANFPIRYGSQDVKPYYEMTPEISVITKKNASKINVSGDVPEVIVNAPRPTIEEMHYYGMMSEVVITAEQFPQTNIDVVYARPNPAIDYSQSSVKYFYLYTAIIAFGVLAYAGIKTFLPTVHLRPISGTLSHVIIKRHNHSSRKRL